MGLADGQCQQRQLFCRSDRGGGGKLCCSAGTTQQNATTTAYCACNWHKTFVKQYTFPHTGMHRMKKRMTGIGRGRKIYRLNTTAICFQQPITTIQWWCRNAYPQLTLTSRTRNRVRRLKNTTLRTKYDLYHKTITISRVGLARPVSYTHLTLPTIYSV